MHTTNNPSDIYRFKYKQPLRCGFLSPFKQIENAVKKFCWQEGLECQFLKSGILVKDIDILISGEGTESQVKSWREALDNYFKSLDNYFTSLFG